MSAWDPARLPSQRGRTIVVTGGSTGLGYWVCEQLAAAGARIVMAARNPARADAAIASIRQHVPDADIRFVRFDLTSLAAIAEAAERIAEMEPVDVLVNNAGRVGPPLRRRTTEDGLELMVGGNALGHFALTARLWPRIAPAGRVVGVGSLSTAMVRLDSDDLMSERAYRPFRAYAFSKHAVHGFAAELHRRLQTAGDPRRSMLAHPGYSTDLLAPRRPLMADDAPLVLRPVGWIARPAAQGKDRGAAAIVRAAIDPEAESGMFYGPARGLTGPPVLTAPVSSSWSPEFGARLWALAEELTGVRFEV